MSHIKRLFDSYAEERLADASPEEVERYREVFMAGAVVIHALYGDPSRTFARQRRKMREVVKELLEYRAEAIAKEMRGASDG